MIRRVLADNLELYERLACMRYLSQSSASTLTLHSRHNHKIERDIPITNSLDSHLAMADEESRYSSDRRWVLRLVFLSFPSMQGSDRYQSDAVHSIVLFARIEKNSLDRPF